jgi:hypothetical protein
MVSNEKVLTDKHIGSDPLVVFNQEKVWPYQVSLNRQPLYIILQLLERREEYYAMNEKED